MRKLILYWRSSYHRSRRRVKKRKLKNTARGKRRGVRENRVEASGKDITIGGGRLFGMGCGRKEGGPGSQ